jgi:hypothetical protein
VVSGGSAAGFETVDPPDVVPEPELENDPLAQPPSISINVDAASHGSSTSTSVRGILLIVRLIPSIVARFIQYSFLV